MQCPKCQTELRDGTQFCTNCGYRMRSEINTQKAIQAQPQSAITKKEKSTKDILIIIGSALLLLFIGAIIVFSVSDSNARAMKKALQNKDVNRVQALYNQAANDMKKRNSYDKALLEYVKQIYTDLNSHEFEEDAIRSGAAAVTSYLQSEYGSLVTQSGNDGLAYCMSGANQEEWEKLQKLIDSKIEYCVGVMTYKGEGHYEDAIQRLTNVSESDASYTKAKQYLEECISAYIEKIMAQADTYMQNDDLSGSLSLLQSAEQFLTDAGVSAELIQTKMQEVTLTYAQKYVAKAEEAFKNKDVDGAIGNMNAALELQPDNGEYQAKLENYKLYLPFKLYLESNCLNVNSDGSFHGTLYFNKNMVSNDNREMPNSIYWYQNASGGGFSSAKVANYELKGNYDLVTGTIFLPQRDKNNNNFTGYFDVYGDGVLIYTSPKITAGVLPQDVSFSVTGVQNLKIAFRADGDSSNTADFGLSNLTAQKKIPE